MRLEELRHHLHIESAVSDGARNVIRILQNTKSADKKQQSEVGNRSSNNEAVLTGLFVVVASLSKSKYFDVIVPQSLA